MRIVAGKLKGRSIRTPDGKSTRPTTDRVRESVFNLLEHNDDMPSLDGARVIDLFAGSGALGFESISRGASFCLFVEIAAGARGIIRENIEEFQLFGITRIHRRSATDLGKKPAGLSDPFNLVFLDPPYNQGLVAPALRQLEYGEWITSDAVAIVEADSEEELEVTNWEQLDERLYGDTKVRIYRYSPQT